MTRDTTENRAMTISSTPLSSRIEFGAILRADPASLVGYAARLRSGDEPLIETAEDGRVRWRLGAASDGTWMYSQLDDVLVVSEGGVESVERGPASNWTCPDFVDTSNGAILLREVFDGEAQEQERSSLLQP